MMVRWRGSSPVRAPKATVGVDFEALVTLLRISHLILSSRNFTVDNSTLLHQTTAAYVILERNIAV